MEILIKVDDIELNIKGEFFEEERDERGTIIFPSGFEIEDIELYKGDLYDLCEFVSAQKGDYLKDFENKVLDKLREQ